MSNLYDKLYEDLKACALSAIPVDSDDGTTFIRTDGAAPIWGPPEVVADAVASATYTVVGIRLDDARAEGVAAGRTAEDVRILAIVAAEPWLLHRPVECVNVRCTEGRWCIGCDPNGETDCAEHPWPCPVVREQNPAWAAGRKQAAAGLADLRERFAALGVIEEYIGESCDNASHNIREVLKGDDPRPNADRWGLDYRAVAYGPENVQQPHALTDDLRGDGPCDDCDALDNIVWFTDSPFWNDVVRREGRDAILCIPCFVKRVDASGYYPTGWRLLPDFHWETKPERAARIAEGGEPNA